MSRCRAFGRAHGDVERCSDRSVRSFNPGDFNLENHSQIDAFEEKKAFRSSIGCSIVYHSMALRIPFRMTDASARGASTFARESSQRPTADSAHRFDQRK